MPDRPNAAELIEAVFEFLAGEVLPAADDLVREVLDPPDDWGDRYPA